jgi:DNA repair protein RadC
VAALEFSRRRIAADGVKVRTPDDVIPLVAHLNDRKQEVFVCVSLSGAHEVIATRIVTVGLANMCQVHPREVLADPIVDRACSIIVAHNHPSGDLTPSDEDLKVTSRLKSAAAILGINLLDHIVFSRRGFRSILHQS